VAWAARPGCRRHPDDAGDSLPRSPALVRRPVRAVKVSPATLARHEQEHEHTAALPLKLRSGVLATLVATNDAPIEGRLHRHQGGEIHGSEGHIMLEGDRLRLASTRPGYELPTFSFRPSQRGARRRVRDRPGPRDHQLRQGDSPVRSAHTGRHLMAVRKAAYASAGEDRESEDRESDRRATAGVLGLERRSIAPRSEGNPRASTRFSTADR
jgi:hypothetical protein